MRVPVYICMRVYRYGCAYTFIHMFSVYIWVCVHMCMSILHGEYMYMCVGVCACDVCVYMLSVYVWMCTCVCGYCVCIHVFSCRYA